MAEKKSENESFVGRADVRDFLMDFVEENITEDTSRICSDQLDFSFSVEVENQDEAESIIDSVNHSLGGRFEDYYLRWEVTTTDLDGVNQGCFNLGRWGRLLEDIDENQYPVVEFKVGVMEDYIS